MYISRTFLSTINRIDSAYIEKSTYLCNIEI